MNALILITALALGQTETPPFTAQQQGELAQIRKNADMIAELSLQMTRAGRNDDAAALDKLLTAQVGEAERVSGGRVKTLADLYTATGEDNPAASPWEQAKGLLTFHNVMVVAGSVLAGVAAILLFGYYFLDLIRMIPAVAWEGVLWVGLAALACSAAAVVPDWQLSVLMPACVGFVGATMLTCHLHGGASKRYEVPAGMLAVAWGVVAVAFGSYVVGFMAVMAALSALGFVCGHLPGVVFMGFTGDDAVPRTTLAAGLMLGLHVLLTATGTAAPEIAVFRDGMNFMGSFVYFLGVLVLASKYYCWTYRDGRWAADWRTYWLTQALVVVSGMAAIYFGTVFGMSVLLGFGGTIFAVYVLEKYYELPWRGAGWAWSLLGLGGLLYAIGIAAKAYPAYFLFG